MPKDQQMPRQRPVSCSFCRKRKLRCSRELPECANCKSRGVQCDLGDIVKQSSFTVEDSSRSEILERLQRLEQLLAAQQSRTSVLPTQETAAPQLPSTSQPSELDSQIQSLNQDVALLESIYLDDQFPKHGELPSSRVIFRTCFIKDIDQARLWFCSPDPSLPASSEPMRCLWLPVYSEAHILLQKYIRVAAQLPWVTHIPSLPAILNEVYTAMQGRHQPKPGPVILLLSIFACATNSWTTSDCEEYGLHATPTTAIDQTVFWAKAAQDVLHISLDEATTSVEGIQGAIIIFFLLAKLEGMSRKCRRLYASTFYLAWDLGLHRIDHPDNASKADSMEAEIGRRVFWYLCASDWQLAARFNGVNEGVYTCHLRQIITKRPKHADDEDMLKEQPLSIPTTMSYPLHRIKISEICRRMVDRNPLSSAQLGEPSHEDIMDIDGELQELLNEVQPFFSMPQEELIVKYKLNADKADDIVQQGHTLRLLLYSLRCKLHLPFFTRGYTTSALPYSKDICIKSARLLIQSQSHLLDIDVSNGTIFPCASLLLGVFMGSIVLLVDLCMNKARGLEDLHRGDICKAFRLLESARHESETSARFVESLTQVLRKHKVNPPKQPPLQAAHIHHNIISSGEQAHSNENNSGMIADSGSALMTPDSSAFVGFGGEIGMAQTNAGFGDEDMSSYFNDLAESFQQGQAVDDYDWDNIFTDLNSSFV